ncbi:MAG TPA: hypothetical protein VMJ93_11990 [Verrucomicrobiae bacterium]|nr:hypothetical protein [Verrucomicrobiae bacterium]
MKNAPIRVGTISFVIFAVMMFALTMSAAAAKSQDAAGEGQTPRLSKETLTVYGKLTQAMGVGGETTGWMIELDTEATIEGKRIHSIEVDYKKKKKLEKLVDQHVEAEGKLTHVQGVETGERLVLELTSIKSAPK